MKNEGCDYLIMKFFLEANNLCCVLFLLDVLFATNGKGALENIFLVELSDGLMGRMPSSSVLNKP
jgi:hypothetical protein